MSYEVEAIGTNSPNPTASAPIMREDKVIDPYRSNVPRGTKPQNPPTRAADTGQKAIDTVAAPPTEETVRLSPQVAALARREQKFRQERESLSKEKAKLESEKTELAQLRTMKEKLAAKDYSAFDEVVDYNDYSQYKVNKLNGTDPVQEEIKKLQEKISGLEKQTEDTLSKQFDAAVQERRNAAQELVDKTDRFPRIKKAKAHEAVVQHILDTWEHDNTELSVEQASKEVEELLLERARQWASLLEDQKIEDATAEKKQLPPLKQQLKTLTNQVTAGDLGRPRPLYGLNDNERWAEARRRAEAKLQQR